MTQYYFHSEIGSGIRVEACGIHKKKIIDFLIYIFLSGSWKM